MSLETMSAQELFDNGVEREKLEDYETAIKYLVAAHKKDPKLSQVYTLLGNCYLKTKDAAKAIKAYKKSIDTSNDPAAHQNLGLLYYHLKMYGKAAHYLHQAEKGGFQTVELYFCLGKALFLDKQFTESEKALERGIKNTSSPELVEIRDKLKNEKKRLNQKFPGVKQIMSEIDKHPDVITNYTQLATHYIKQNDWQKVEDVLKNAVSANPNNLIAYTNLAAFYFDRDRFKEATEFLERAIKVRPDEVSDVNLNLYLNLAQGYIYINQKKKALKILDAALKINHPKSELIQKMIDGLKKLDD